MSDYTRDTLKKCYNFTKPKNKLLSFSSRNQPKRFIELICDYIYALTLMVAYKHR